MSGTDTSRGGSMRSSHGLAEYPNHPLSVKKRFLTPFLPPNTVEEYAYDGLHRRTVKKKYTSGSLSETRHYYYSDAWQVLEERVDNSGTLDIDRQFIWGLRYVDDLIRRDRYSSGAISETRFAMQDANFNVTAVTDSNGDVQERYRYDAYGMVTALNPTSFAPTGNPPANDWETLYAGYRWDAATGLYLVRHRTYHPPLGRWMQRDPTAHASREDLYAYVGNNPITLTDRYGLQPGHANQQCCCGPDITTAIMEHLNDFVTQPEGDLWPIMAASAGDIAAIARQNGWAGAFGTAVSNVVANHPECGCGRCTGTVTLGELCISRAHIDHILIMVYLAESYGLGKARAAGRWQESGWLWFENAFPWQARDAVTRADLTFNEIALCISMRLNKGRSGGLTHVLIEQDIMACTRRSANTRKIIGVKRAGPTSQPGNYWDCPKCDHAVPKPNNLRLPPIDL